MSEPMIFPIHRQSLLVTDNVNTNILANQILDPTNLPSRYTNLHDSSKSMIANNMINIPVHEILTKSSNNSKSSEFDLICDDIMELEDEKQLKMRSQSNTTNDILKQFQTLDTFISSQANTLFTEPKTIDNAILPQTIFLEQNQYDNALKLNITKVHQTESRTVGPIDYVLDSRQSVPCKTVQMQHDPPNKQQFIEYDVEQLKKIQLKCQPRSKFRPRTQNESKNSHHYLRCEEGAEHDYPTIYVPKTWSSQSNFNIIEVALVGLDKEPHPYSLNNKTSKTSFDGQTLVVKQTEDNILYFRLINEDFLNGFKTFMIELIKSKQDNIITKKLIQQKQLDQSMLRFTRIYRDEFDKFHRDDVNQEYSCIMTESYGTVAVEHMGPRYGPMRGEEMMFIGLRGRIVKDDLSIIISEQTTGWSQEMKKFMLNGNIAYFPMPAFPYPNMHRVKASVSIYFKKQNIHESDYLYIALLDQELAELKSNDPMCTSMVPNNSDDDITTSMHLMPFASQKPLKTKRTKRLNSK